MQINSAKLIIEILDETTGELITREATLGDFKEPTKKATTTRTRKSKTDDEPTPMLHVLEGKIQMNTKAQELCGFEPEQKINILFEKKGRVITPVMCVDDKNGNRLTKTYTISCRGQKRENLIQYGDTFEVIPYEEKEGYFKLIGNVKQPEDDIVDVPEEITSVDDIDSSIDLDNLDFSF